MDLRFGARRVHLRFQVPNFVQISAPPSACWLAVASLSDALQTLCFMAGANSIFYGGKLLSTGSPDTAHDQNVFERLMTRWNSLRPSSSPLPRQHSAP